MSTVTFDIPFLDDVTKVPKVALLEAAVMQLCLTRIDESGMRDLLTRRGETVSLIQFAPDTDRIKPGWALYWQHESKTLVLAVRGTTIIGQWFVHIGGTWGTRYTRDSVNKPIFCHYGMQFGALEAYAAVKAAIAGGLRPNRIVLMGHSYGGGVATWIARSLIYDGYQDRTTLITFGSPRVFTSGFDIEPAVMIRVQHEDDVVPSMPPPLVSPRVIVANAIEGWGLGRMGFNFLVKKLGVQGLAQVDEGIGAWKHMGPGLNLFRNGTVVGAVPRENSVVAFFSDPGSGEFANDHYMDTAYWPSLKAATRAQGALTPHEIEVMGLGDEIMEDPIEESRDPPWNDLEEAIRDAVNAELYQYTPPPTVVELERAEGVDFNVFLPAPQFVGGLSNMATEIKMLFTCTTGIGMEGAPQRVGDWSERVWHSSNDYNAVLLSLQPSGPEAADSLWAARRKLLPTSCKIVGYRLQAYDLSGGVLIPVGGARPDRLGYPGTSTVGGNDTPKLAVELRMQCADVDKMVTLEVGGIPDDAVVGGEIINGPNNFFASINAYIRRLVACGLGSVVQNMTGIAPQKIRMVTPGAGGIGTVAGLLPLTGFTPGNQAVVRRSQDTCRRGRGGHYRVISLTAGVLTIAGWEWGTTTKGTVFPYSRTFASYVEAGSNFVQCNMRQVGSPFDRFVGRRSRKRA